MIRDIFGSTIFVALDDDNDVSINFNIVNNGAQVGMISEQCLYLNSKNLKKLINELQLKLEEQIKEDIDD